MLDYAIIGVFIIVIFFVGSILSLLPLYLFGHNEYTDGEKLSSYECGFDSFGNNFFEFNIQFYLVSLLFMPFDVEVMFIYPWTLVISVINGFEIFVMFIFLLLLTLGFCFEWYKGILDRNHNKSTINHG